MHAAPWISKKKWKTEKKENEEEAEEKKRKWKNQGYEFINIYAKLTELKLILREEFSF